MIVVQNPKLDERVCDELEIAADIWSDSAENVGQNPQIGTSSIVELDIEANIIGCENRNVGNSPKFGGPRKSELEVSANSADERVHDRCTVPSAGRGPSRLSSGIHSLGIDLLEINLL